MNTVNSSNLFSHFIYQLHLSTKRLWDMLERCQHVMGGRMKSSTLQQLNARPLWKTNKGKDPITYTPRVNLEFPVQLTGMCLDCEIPCGHSEDLQNCKQHHYATWQIPAMLLDSAHKVPQNYFCTFSCRDSQLMFSWRFTTLSIKTHESANPPFFILFSISLWVFQMFFHLDKTALSMQTHSVHLWEWKRQINSVTIATSSLGMSS